MVHRPCGEHPHTIVSELVSRAHIIVLAALGTCQAPTCRPRVRLEFCTVSRLS